ncbi:MAG: peptidase M23, partial [Chloroflexi bacterium HGW-Chloroflexi-9]
MVEVSEQSGVPWALLAAIASVESGFGANMATSWAGAIGYGQFMPASWAHW